MSVEETSTVLPGWITVYAVMQFVLIMKSGCIIAVDRRSKMVGDDWTKPEASLRKGTSRNLTCRM